MNDPARDFSLIRKHRQTRLRHRVLAAAIPAALAVQFLVAGAARAQNIWAAGTGSWFVPGNWSPAAVPTAADDAQINNGGTAQILSGAAVSADSYLAISPGSMGTVLVSGPGSTWTNTSAFLVVGFGGTGLLTIQNGGAVSNDFGFIGSEGGSNGTGLVTGSGSNWTNINGLSVGSRGTGLLTIQNGATVSSNGGRIGENIGGNGTVLVTGPGSTWTNSGLLEVGNNGTGLLTIQNGARVSNTSAGIADFSDSGGVSFLYVSHGTVLVTGRGSAWTNSGNISVGDDGMGLLAIQDGATVSVGGGTGVANLGGSSGTGILNIGAFGGGTTAGTLQAGSVNGGFGTAIINFNQTDTTAFTPQITGSIAVNQLGTGATILTGANTYTGGTTISAGTLRTLNAGALGSGGVTLNGGDLNPVGALTVSNLNWGPGRVVLARPSSDGGATGDILNATTLTKNSGGGAYVLGQVSQNVLYTLTTFATNSGFNATDFSAQSINPAVTFQGIFTLNPGNVQFTITGASVTLGSGSLLQNSAPVYIPTFADVTLTGPVTTGGPGDNNTIQSLTFTPGSSLTIFNTLFVTQGPVILVGGSSITLDGSLSVNQLKMLFGSSLNGSGNIIGDLINGGFVSPGHSPGQIHVSGNYTQTATGTLRIEIAGRDLSQHDLLSVDGTATLGGTLQLVRLNNFRLKRHQPVTFLTANGGVSGEFATVENGFTSDTILEPTVVYHAGSVAFEAVQGSFERFAESWGLTPNQKSVARSLDSAANDRRANPLFDYLDGRKLGKLPGDFDKIAPEELTSIFAIGTSLANVQAGNIQRRTDDIRSGSSGFSAAGLALNGNNRSYSGGFNIATGVAGPSGDAGKEVKETRTIAPAENRWGVFLSGTGEWISVGNTDNARGYDLTSGGFTLGVDYKVCPNFAIGLAAGYTGTTADLTARGRVWVNGGKLGLYATTFSGGWYADTAVFGGYNSYDTRRGALQGEARGNTDGRELNVLFGTGYDFKAGALTFGPTATFNYTYLGLSGFDEHGSLAPLSIHSGKEESLRTAFGFKASYDWKVGGVVIKPEVRAAWQHEYGDAAYALDSSFANGAGSTFTVNGPQLGRDSALLGAGFAIQCSERCSTYFYYDGELGRKNYQSTNVTGGLRVAF